MYHFISKINSNNIKDNTNDKITKFKFKVSQFPIDLNHLLINKFILFLKNNELNFNI